VSPCASPKWPRCSRASRLLSMAARNASCPI
jgi:hypothetical protein